MEKDPLSYQWLTYAWVIFISLWAGIANYCKRIKYRESVPFSLAEFIGDITISGFVGVLTFFICESARINPMLSAAIIGISAHMGSRALFMLEQLLVILAKRRSGIEP